MSEPNGLNVPGNVDQARRRLAALMLATPWAGALHAAGPPVVAPAEPSVSLLAKTSPPEAPADGEPHTGRWVHAFAA